MQCVILAGGLATRLRPLTEKIPKSMVPIDGKPFLQYQLDLLQKNDVKDVLLCVGYLGRQIEEYFGDGSQFNVNIRYSFEAQHLLGTGGALRNAIDLLEDRFFVLYGDSWLNIDYKNVYKKALLSGSPAVLVIYKNQSRWDKSNVVIKDGFVTVYNKNHLTPEMQYIDYGLSVLSKSIVLERIPAGVFYDLAETYKTLACEGKLAACEVFKRFYETGSMRGLKEFSELVRKGLS